MQELTVGRDPALRTGEFGDCLGGQSLFNITRFDAAYYHGANKTIAFHLEGSSNIENGSLMSKSKNQDDRKRVGLTDCQSSYLSTHVIHDQTDVLGRGS